MACQVSRQNLGHLEWLQGTVQQTLSFSVYHQQGGAEVKWVNFI
jgi:hypothetical protein